VFDLSKQSIFTVLSIRADQWVLTSWKMKKEKDFENNSGSRQKNHSELTKIVRYRGWVKYWTR